jgi:hypothetical protein
LASSIVNLIDQQVIKNGSAIQLIVDPVPENGKSIRALEKSGYVLCPATGLYKLQITEG